MILDSSALMAVVFNEPDEPVFLRAMTEAAVLRISAATWVESWIVLNGRDNLHAETRFEDLADELAIEMVPVTREIAYRARAAHRAFGKGNHRAGLNFGDCFSYALAKETGEALLFKGNDFSRTDIQSALAP